MTIASKLGVCYDVREIRWADLTPDLYIPVNGELWRTRESRDGAWLVENTGTRARQVWPRQPDDKAVPIADLHPQDPVALLRGKLGASAIGWKRHDQDIWVAPPWYDELPPREPSSIYALHLREMHGLQVSTALPYEELLQMHREHHTEGVQHPIMHTHPDRRPRP